MSDVPHLPPVPERRVALLQLLRPRGAGQRPGWSSGGLPQVGRHRCDRGERAGRHAPSHVGRDHAALAATRVGDLGESKLIPLSPSSSLDPAGILNPGKLLPGQKEERDEQGASARDLDLSRDQHGRNDRHRGKGSRSVRDFVSGRLSPSPTRMRQPYGIVHGGAIAALAESLTSDGDRPRAVMEEEKIAMGQELNVSFMRPINEGHVNAYCRPSAQGQDRLELGGRDHRRRWPPLRAAARDDRGAPGGALGAPSLGAPVICG